MSTRGPVAKSAEVRVLEGQRAHRPLPPPSAPRCIPGMPERPKGMPAAARRVWDGYIAQLAPLGILRRVDGYALSRLCEDVAYLQEIRTGMRRLAKSATKLAKEDKREIPGGAVTELAMSQDGRRLNATINALAQRIKRDEIQFGLTPVASTRLENIVVPFASASAPASALDPMEAALCG